MNMSKPGSINSAYINTGWIQIKIPSNCYDKITGQLGSDSDVSLQRDSSQRKKFTMWIIHILIFAIGHFYFAGNVVPTIKYES